MTAKYTLLNGVGTFRPLWLLGSLSLLDCISPLKKAQRVFRLPLKLDEISLGSELNGFRNIIKCKSNVKFNPMHHTQHATANALY